MIWRSISPTRRDKSPPRQVGSIWDGLPGVLSNGLHQHTAGQVLFRSSKAFLKKKKRPKLGDLFFWGEVVKISCFFCFLILFFGGMYRKHVQNKELLYFWVWSVWLSWMGEDNGKHIFNHFQLSRNAAFTLKFGLCGASVGWPKWLRSKSNKWNKKT